ncbi:MAG: helix-hairpin-helix domain-containing protein [Saprospiraceae bacterium]
MSRQYIPIVLFLLSHSILWGQVDTLNPPLPDRSGELIEDILNNAEEETDFDFNTAFEDLDAYLQSPLDLNEASETDLRDLGLFSDVQILNFLQYRQVAGTLISLYELQAVPGMDLATIRNVLPYVRVRGDVDDYQLSLIEMITKGKNEVYNRWFTVLEDQKGYSPLEDGETSSRYLGDQHQLYFRFKHSYGNRLSYGLTAEKDRGEEFFRGNNTKGFDFYSAHFYLRNYNKRLIALAIGDYGVSLGQGLIFFSGFNYGKSALVATIKRSGRQVRAYSSVNEINFMRGAAATLGIGDRLAVTVFGSYKGIDGNLVLPDSTDSDVLEASISSLNATGYHRTQSEVDDRNALQQLTTGASLKYSMSIGHIALNGVYHHFSKALESKVQPYNQFYFRGKQLTNASLDYNFRLGKFNLFGETAASDNGSIATLNGLLTGLDPKVDFALLFRHYPKDYWSIGSSAFAETSGTRNETGFYTGIVVRPNNNWIVSAYFDIWEHPWLRFQVDAPSKGYEYRVRLTYFKKRQYEAYIEVRDEIKEQNVPIFETKSKDILPSRRFQSRFNFSYKVNKAVELRSRLDLGFADNEINSYQDGFAIYQDIIFKPIGFPLSFTTRFALFDTDGYQVRFYNFENNLLYTFAIPAYYNRGSRFYINLRYKGIRNMTVEARFAQLYWSDQPSIGSGLEEINGPVRTEVSAQIKYQF